MQMSSRKRSRDEVDCDGAKRGVWLVKVPKYLSDIWEANAGSDVGRLNIASNNGKTVVKLKNRQGLTMPDNMEGATSKGGSIPEEHSFIIGDIVNQTMVVLGEDKTGLNEDINIRTGSLSLEGRVVKRAECRPPDSLAYLKMKIGHIEKSGQPKRHIQTIDKAAVKYKPVNMHEEDMARIKQKKEGIKTVRMDKDVLRQNIFMQFEKHEYYRLQDLQQLMNQPASYVKEILQEIAVYNSQPPHKSMWNLKPEYRNYST
ncbi:hypothetical protein PENTCL1PPCAC_2324 [Pristionchus entomophagus]|uniref:General transcription factor IIF subunit 2 n=1 Tax=Pristionchus entomophagus TaxID=358040 RepID=A0AAV5SBI4_9BILA|nr:hypothetical protein PENTCL1PPCAC_2324 [Pristionchus entomophagus]